MRANRAGGARKPSRPAPVAVLTPPESSGAMEDVVRRELDAAGVLDTSAGQAAVLLARTADAGHPQPAGLVKQMHESMDRVLAKQAGRSRLELMRERRSS